jgi:RNA polymerase sigma factor (sigma-70 family)
MNTDTQFCKQFEDDKVMVEALLAAEDCRKRVLTCLYNLYAEECIRWLIKKFGKKKGITDIHYAHESFNDSLLALEYSVNQGRFDPDRRANAGRRFIYRVSFLRYLKFIGKDQQRTKFELSGSEDVSIYPVKEISYSIEEKEKKRKLQEAVGILPMEYRSIFHLRYVEGLRIKEIASDIGLPSTEVSSILFRYKDKFKNILIRTGFDF